MVRDPSENYHVVHYYFLHTDNSSWSFNDSSDEAVYEMHDKLLVIWDCLQIPTLTRISFMRKYSSEAYSVEMGRAVDMWGEATVFVLFLLELAKCLRKVKVCAFVANNVCFLTLRHSPDFSSCPSSWISC
jgi:hypothetical protein